MTMLANLGARDRRALLAGLGLMLPALTYVGIVRPYVRADREVREQIAIERDALARELDLLEQAPSLSGEIDRTALQLTATSRRLYSGSEPVALTAALARDVRAAFDDAGAVVHRIDARDAVPASAGVRDLSLEVRASGDLESILAAVASLEAGRKLVRVTRISIDRDGMASATEAQPLSVIATIHGYAR